MKSNKIKFEKYKQIKEKIEHLKKKIIKAAIRRKYLALKLGKAEEDENINGLLKPIIDPLWLKFVNVEKGKNSTAGLKPEEEK